MFRRLSTEKVEVKKLNEIILLSSHILKITSFLLLILGIYAITLIVEKWNILTFVLTILNVISPFFIGLFVAWLFDPIVHYLEDKKINRTLGTVIVYIVLLILLYILLSTIIPLFSSQINDFVSTIPNIVNALKNWISRIFIRLNIDNNSSIKIQTFNLIEQYQNNITTKWPTFAVNFITSFVSGVGSLLMGLMIGFFMLCDFDNFSVNIMKAIPKKIKFDVKKLLKEINVAFKNFVYGTLIIAFIVFIIASLGFYAIGLKAPLLLGFICGLTNIIPIIGPYIGGALAVLVGLVESPTTGILTTVMILVVHFIESELVVPLILSKTMNIHPVSITVGLLVFGHLFGIMGMIISTPLVALIKILLVFFNNKYKIFSFRN
jgi:predicted PurR-regulated permease PerM